MIDAERIAEPLAGHQRLSAWRVLLGFVLAPLVPLALLFGGVGIWVPTTQWWSLFPWVLVIGGYGPTILVGVPLFFALIGTVRTTVLSSVVAGTAVATIPWFAILAVMRPDYSFSNGHVTTRNGVITLDGLVDLLWIMIPFGIVGSVSGFVFWLAALAGTRR
jgi:hypothetical protein